KSRAKVVGATDLYYISVRLEQRAKKKDLSYIQAELPLFLHEWMRADEGLRLFLSEFTLENDSEIDKTKEAEPALSKEDLIEKLLEALADYKNRESATYLEQLFHLENDKKLQESLYRMKEKIEMLDFEDAQQLVKEYKRKQEKRWMVK
ncbi:MAG: hypothetical protein Q4B70_19250, partial [Lachnospiraceae bacterium]|nr:hypothetical protein [Lachnospiraceae bacterium]